VALAARAQEPAHPVIGYLSARSPDDTWHLVEAFRRGLREGGFVEGQNVTVEYHWLEGQFDRLPAFMTDLVRRRVAVMAGGYAAGVRVDCGGEKKMPSRKAWSRGRE
jgi:putative ABC transport system substrate-binding protein